MQTGDDDDRATVQSLTGLDETYFVPTGWSFTEPLSPHRASELEERQDEITVARLFARLQRHKIEGPLLVEGAGGLLVPLHRGLRETWLDFLMATGLPVVIVARTALGTINHSLLTVQALRAAEIPIAGLLFCGEENEDNRRTIREFSGADDLGRFYLNDGRDIGAATVDLTPLLRMLS